MVSGRFIPQRIFRGRIIDALRDVPKGMDLATLGATITPDWHSEELKPWLTELLKKLEQDALIECENDHVHLRQSSC